MKQTALNYLIDKLELKVLSQHMPFVDNIISEALEMEKEQMGALFYMGMVNGINIDFEQFYKETYESND